MSRNWFGGGFEDADGHAISESDFRAAADCEMYDAMGADRPEVEYLLDGRDAWVKNPHYVGLPGRHPEDEGEDFDPEAPGVPDAGSMPPNCDFPMDYADPPFDPVEDEIPF